MSTIEWRDNNGGYEAREQGQFIGLVSQNPPGTVNEGLWTFAIYPLGGGLISHGPFRDADQAMWYFERGHEAGYTYEEWLALGAAVASA